MSSTIYEAFLNKTLKINPPLSETAIEEIVKKSSFKPSKALVEFWKKVGPTEILYSSIKIVAPSEAQKVDPFQFEGYKGYPQVANLHFFLIGMSWYGTDSHAYWFESADGEHKGKLVMFSYSALAIYFLDKDMKDLIDFIKDVKYDDDVNISQELDEKFVGSAPPLKNYSFSTKE